MSTLFRSISAETCLLMLIIGLAVSCSSGGGGGTLVVSSTHTGFELVVDDGSYIDEGKAVFNIEQSKDGADTVITIQAGSATGLKAFYGDLFYDAGSFTAVDATSGTALGDEGSVLNLEVLSDPGVVHLGQIVTHPDSTPGLTGAAVIATVRFVAEPAPAPRRASTVPRTAASRTDLVWDVDQSLLSWRYVHLGDYNQDGFVTVSDLTPLGINFGTAGPFDPVSALSCVDGNNDGMITVNDITPIGISYGNMITGYQIYSSATNDFPDDPAAGNGSATMTGWVEFSAAEAPEGERLLFNYLMTEAQANRYFRVRPSNGLDEGTPSTVASTYPFEVEITGEITEGSVPFHTVLTANQIELSGNGPIEYTWHCYDDLSPGNDSPIIGSEPSLSVMAAVFPTEATGTEVNFHIGNTAGADEAKSYAIQVTAIDALGQTATSPPFRVLAYPPEETTAFYHCENPLIKGELIPGQDIGRESANPIYNAYTEPEPWSGRANPAVAMHPSGLAFILGGELLNPDGSFAGLVERGDSAYAYVPAVDATTTGESTLGKFASEDAQGCMIRLADDTAPAFPGSPAGPMSPSNFHWPYPEGDTRMPFQVDPEQMPAWPPAVPTLRSAPFEIVGSAAAVYVNERPETNPAGAYPDAGTNAGSMLPTVIDRDVQGMSEIYLWAWPDCCVEGWNTNTAYAGSIPGSGAPAVYVIGGRGEDGRPVDLVQKYLPWGFGGEDVVPWSQTYEFQATGNQTNIWSPYFLRPDTDQFPGDNENFAPDIPNRLPDGEPGNEQVLPTLPEALYGLAATKLQTGVETPAPDYPNGPYSYIYIFGGINAAGEVSNAMRIWDTTRPATLEGNGDLVFSELPVMPAARAYARAVFLPGFEYRIALVGGIGADGGPVETIDIYTFDDIYNPTTGSWSTFGGTLAEAAWACGAGCYETGTDDLGLIAYGGYYTDEEAGTVMADTGWTLGVDGAANSNIQAPLLLPRAWAGTGQVTTRWLTEVRMENMLGPVELDRYYVFGGLDESGNMSAAVEVFGILTD